MNIALIIAGGIGARMNQSIPKQFMSINDKPIIIYTLEKFEKHPAIDEIVVVSLNGWENILLSYAKQFKITKLRHITKGGDSGQESIKNGILKLKEFYSDDDIVLIHDAIRPNVSEEIISDAIRVINEKGSAVSVIPCNEAMLVSNDGGINSRQTYDRQKLKRTQTPQGATLKALKDLHDKAEKMGIKDSVATCTLMIETGGEIYFSIGSEKNIKITTMDDIDIFKALLK
ncbi:MULTISPECIES: IspD/TarI family cytidylyltransferase [unclassified Campylobacter]|uniref:IspD/TarI family cytidylyltransferase n=1 Tax=unclassified Campylobacter TaxID=2593542 RepID=UPI0021E6CB4F|nr:MULTISPECIES: IspD/TarI family cytidylyltransferase [unclassified Campylobacter]EGK7484744.1 2-C-methyl-D-erythritol 4-phosphate cytidylyltransferase [Campylobacter lari]MCR8682681.1 2-C-methyl-D-erythritol 4-phosphate cytidylyltransferase [Campylobacter sp. LMG 17559]MCV3393738.1 2-C-methyl-D-erythritol 4-phosphate cytidylyltransferase [Campylobacter sp. IFREMER_LSEM_CL908]MCV3434379.1 2-C-methyl-D-erythritol 4-phosphate cytidylyltransferase [Campylobacter sp. IFREMER_LSEM_CL1846]HEC174856